MSKQITIPPPQLALIAAALRAMILAGVEKGKAA